MALTPLLRAWNNYGFRDAKRVIKHNLASQQEPRRDNPEYALGTQFRHLMKHGSQADIIGAALMINLRLGVSNNTINAASNRTTVDSGDILDRYNEIKKEAPQWRQTLAWRDEDWWDEVLDRYPYHYAHISKEDESKICYFESPAKLWLNRSTRTKPGRYLTKFIPHAPKLKDWALRQQAYAEVCKGKLEFIEHDDEQGWMRVYNDGPGSCMKGDSYVRVYAHSESVLRLAYWTQYAQIQARCIVREDEKQWIRCYPEPDGDQFGLAIRSALDELGYKQGDLNGVLLKAILVDEDKYMCPYVDLGTAGSMNAEPVFRKGREYLLLGVNCDWDAQVTGGVLTAYNEDDEDYCTCSGCNERIHDNDTYCSDHFDHGNAYCESCWNEYTRSAYVSYRYLDEQASIDKDNAIYVGDNWYLNDKRVLRAHGIYKCTDCEEYYHEDDMHELPDSTMVCDDCAICLDVPYNNYEYFPEYLTKTLGDGRVVHVAYEEPEEEEDDEIDPTEVIVPVMNKHPGWPFDQKTPHEEEQYATA